MGLSAGLDQALVFVEVEVAKLVRVKPGVRDPDTHDGLWVSGVDGCGLPVDESETCS